MIKKRIPKAKLEARIETVPMEVQNIEKNAPRKIGIMIAVIVVLIIAGGYMLINRSRSRQVISIISQYVVERVVRADYDEVKLDLKTKGNEILIVDLRPEYEFAGGHLFGEVVNIPLYGNPQEKWKTRISTNALIAAVKAVAKDKKKIVLYGDYANDGIVNEAAVLILMRGLNARVLNIGWKEWSMYYGGGMLNQVNPLQNVPVLPIPKE